MCTHTRPQIRVLLRGGACVTLAHLERCAGWEYAAPEPGLGPAVDTALEALVEGVAGGARVEAQARAWIDNWRAARGGGGQQGPR